jgi:predicted RNase H-like HicB family nuclease
MILDVSIQVWQRPGWFVAKCLELDFVSQGRTREEARRNLSEVIEIQLDEMAQMGTLDDYLAECGYVRKGDGYSGQTEMVGFEKESIRVQ